MGAGAGAGESVNGNNKFLRKCCIWHVDKVRPLVLTQLYHLGTPFLHLINLFRLNSLVWRNGDNENQLVGMVVRIKWVEGYKEPITASAQSRLFKSVGVLPFTSITPFITWDVQAEFQSTPLKEVTTSMLTSGWGWWPWDSTMPGTDPWNWRAVTSGRWAPDALVLLRPAIVVNTSVMLMG